MELEYTLTFEPSGHDHFTGTIALTYHESVDVGDDPVETVWFSTPHLFTNDGFQGATLSERDGDLHGLTLDTPLHPGERRRLATGDQTLSADHRTDRLAGPGPCHAATDGLRRRTPWRLLHPGQRARSGGHGREAGHHGGAGNRRARTRPGAASGAAGTGGGREAAELGYSVVMTPAQHCYLDLAFTDQAADPGYYWAGTVSVRDAYLFEPFAGMEGADASVRQQIRGLQACLWGELLDHSDKRAFMLLPRLPALAERAWFGAEQRDLEDFLDRCRRHQSLWQADGWHYRAPELGW